MPRSASSRAATRVSAETAAFDATYAPNPSVASTPFRDEMLTIEPSSTMCRPAIRMPRNVPVRLSSTILRKSATRRVDERTPQCRAGAVDQCRQPVAGVLEHGCGRRPTRLVGDVQLDEPGAFPERFGQRLAALAVDVGQVHGGAVLVQELADRPPESASRAGHQRALSSHPGMARRHPVPAHETVNLPPLLSSTAPTTLAAPGEAR